MKSNFEEKRAARLEAFKNLAAKNADLSNISFERAHHIGSFIPMGQPILVGHHSEKRHRRDLEKIDNAMRASVEASQKAAYYAERVESLLNGTAISSDDPNAIDKLTEKLEKLEALQELMKAVNKIVKSKKAEIEKVEALQALGISEQRAIKLLEKGEGWHNQPGFPSYRLTNNNATIRNTRQRIEYLQKMASIESSEEEINGVRLVISSEDNRVQMFFAGKPSEEIRTRLKGSGFHWAHSVGCWMRLLSNHSIYQARTILNSL